MEIISKNISDLIFYENNPRDNDSAVTKVAESILQFGFVNPVAIDCNNVIISGHTRVKAAIKLGMEQVPCIVHALKDDDARLVRIIDNKSHKYATWDIGLLHKELEAINLPVKNSFFNVSKTVAYYIENKILAFGKTEISISDDEYSKLKDAYDEYIQRNKTYLGFITFLVGDNSQKKES